MRCHDERFALQLPSGRRRFPSGNLAHYQKRGKPIGLVHKINLIKNGIKYHITSNYLGVLMSYIIYTTKPIFRTVLTIFPQCRLVLDLCQSNWCARLTCGSFRITDYLHQTMVSLTSSLGFLFSSSLGRRSMCGCCLISEVNAHQTWPKKLNKTKRVKLLWSPHALSSFN